MQSTIAGSRGFLGGLASTIASMTCSLVFRMCMGMTLGFSHSCPPLSASTCTSVEFLKTRSSSVEEDSLFSSILQLYVAGYRSWPLRQGRCRSLKGSSYVSMHRNGTGMVVCLLASSTYQASRKSSETLGAHWQKINPIEGLQSLHPGHPVSNIKFDSGRTVFDGMYDEPDEVEDGEGGSSA